MGTINVVSDGKLDAATRVFAAVSALRKVRDEVGLSEHHCSGCHHDYRNELVRTGLGGWHDYEANHGRQATRFVLNELGTEHEKLLKELDDLAKRLQSFGLKVLGIE